MARTSLKCAVIGAGNFGKHYVRLLQDIKGMSLGAIGDQGNWKEIVADPQIDCVIIATPATHHFSIAKTALEAGKHVLLEKPMTRTLKEAEGLRAAVLHSGCIFMVGHQYLYNDYIIHLKSEIEKGTLGKIIYFFAEHLYPGPIREDIGCFWETATHELAIIDYLFSPKKIREVRGSMTDLAGSGRDDFASVWIEFKKAPPAALTVSWMYPEKIRRLALVGEKGSAVFDEQRDEKLKFYLGEKILVPRIAVSEPLQNELKHFIDCIKNKKVPLTDIGHGVFITEMLHKITTGVIINKS